MHAPAFNLIKFSLSQSSKTFIQLRNISTSMQHLHNQVDEKQARKWNFDQKWDNVQRAVTQQNQERFQDIETSKINAQKKLQLITKLENNKISLINQQINYLNSQENQLLNNIHSTIEGDKKYQEDYEQKNIDFINDFLQNSEKFNITIMEYGKSKVKDVSRKLQIIDQNIRRKTDQAMKEIKETGIDHIKGMMISQKERRASNIKQIEGLVGNSLKQMRQSLKQYQKQCQKSQNKISNMMCNLSGEMQKLIGDQNKAGDITYDCLLKLVEESCSKIQQMQLR